MHNETVFPLPSLLVLTIYSSDTLIHQIQSFYSSCRHFLTDVPGVCLAGPIVGYQEVSSHNGSSFIQFVVITFQNILLRF